MSAIIFHSPLAINREALSGSSVRPKEMLQAFKELGIEVLTIDGDSQNRKKCWQTVLNSPQKFLGVYSELSTLPIALTDPDHVPRRPCMDMSMFREMRRRKIPVAAFYRDIYWRFPQYGREYPFFTRQLLKLCAIPLYWHELLQLRHSVSCIFLPSLRMASAIPIQFPENRFLPLPPGSTFRNVTATNTHTPLNFLYVGGVLPPTYDLSQILSIVSNKENATLTICCRKQEWAAASRIYSVADNIKITHASGNELDTLYSSADVFLMYRKMDPYLKFAMPVKLFEAIGAGLPVITNSDCEAGDLVSTQNLGWALPDETSLNQLINKLIDNPELIKEKRRNVQKSREQHTWKSRANQVLTTFDRLRDTNSI